MKLPGWLRGPEDPDPEDEREDVEPGEAGPPTARERARREREERRAEREGTSSRLEPSKRKSAKPDRAKRPRLGPTASKPGSDERTDRPGASSAGKAFAAALKQGAADTRGRSKGVPSGLAKRALAGAAVLFGIFFDLLSVVLNLAIAIWARVRGPLGSGIGLLRRASAGASRALTPIRALAAVACGAAVLLALSQFANYRGISVGTEAYAEVITVVGAPDREVSETGSAHGYAMVPLAIIALALIALAVRDRRWQLCRLIAAGGVAAIAVALIVDRPAGLDTGELAMRYQGVEARLLGGFYAQIFSGLLLATSAVLLGRELRLAGAPSPIRRDRDRSREPGRRGLLRRAAKPEEARA